MKMRVKLFLLIAHSTDKIMNAKPTHQTAGLPIATIVDTILPGKCDRKSHTGFRIKGQVHH